MCACQEQREITGQMASLLGREERGGGGGGGGGGRLSKIEDKL